MARNVKVNHLQVVSCDCVKLTIVHAILDNKVRWTYWLC
jgi:hypothetical protein